MIFICKADNDDTARCGDEEGQAGPQAPEAENSELTLYEGLQIMRKGRFEDQRGTEICFEIPEFLRLPENNRYVRAGSEVLFHLTLYFSAAKARTWPRCDGARV